MNARTVWYLGLPASVLLIALALLGRAGGFNCSGAGHEAYAGVSCDGCANLTVTDSYFEPANTTGGGGVHFEDSGGGHLVARNTIVGGKDGIGTYPEDDASGAFTSG